MEPIRNKQSRRGDPSKRYPQRIKDAVLRMMLPPENLSNTEIHQIVGIPIDTIKKWRSKWKAAGKLQPADNALTADKWSSDSKFAVVMETIKLNEIELTKYCLSKGLSPDQVRIWQENCIKANTQATTTLGELMENEKQNKTEIQQIKKCLKGMEAELAEARALLDLRKKVEAIWGTSETAQEEE
jgi:transposase